MFDPQDSTMTLPVSTAWPTSSATYRRADAAPAGISVDTSAPTEFSDAIPSSRTLQELQGRLVPVPFRERTPSGTAE